MHLAQQRRQIDADGLGHCRGRFPFEDKNDRQRTGAGCSACWLNTCLHRSDLCRSLVHQPEVAADILECREGFVEVLSRVGGRDDGADTRFGVRHSGESDSLREDALLEEAIAQIHGFAAFAGDDGCNGALAGSGVEAEVAQPFLKVASVLPEAIDALRLIEEHVDGGDTGCRHRRRV